MKLRKRLSLIVASAAAALLASGPAPAQEKQAFITIGTGSVNAIYYPAGLAMATILNRSREEFGIRATVESTPGSVFNVNAIVAGYLEFGLVQSDIQFAAVSGLAAWSGNGPRETLRAVLSLHQESVSLVAAVDADIHTLADLKGKRVNLGSPGAGQYRNALDALDACGLDPHRDVRAKTAMNDTAPGLLQGNRIDAFFCTVGHPSQILEEAVSGARRVRLIAVAGPAIDSMIAAKPYYSAMVIPVQRFYPDAVNIADVRTFGVTATLCTSSAVSPDLVFSLTRAVVVHLDEFKKQHPAFAGLTRESLRQGHTAPLHPGAERYFTAPQ